MTKEKIHELLSYSLDNELSPQELKTLEAGMVKFPELRHEQDQLLELRALVSKQKLPPAPAFVDQVMNQIPETQIEKSPGFESTLVWMFPKVAAACVILLLATLLNTYFAEGNISTEALVGIIDLSPDEALTVLTEE